MKITFSSRTDARNGICIYTVLLGNQPVMADTREFDRAWQVFEETVRQYPQAKLSVWEAPDETVLEKSDKLAVMKVLGMDPKCMRLSIFAYHVSQLVEMDAPAKFGLHPCHGVDVQVEILPTQNLVGKEWDRVYLNGKLCGNRAGGVKEFVRLIGLVKPEISYS